MQKAAGGSEPELHRDVAQAWESLNILLVEDRVKKYLEALRMAQLYAPRNTGGIFYA